MGGKWFFGNYCRSIVDRILYFWGRFNHGS
jgi:hypothetical protein